METEKEEYTPDVCELCDGLLEVDDLQWDYVVHEYVSQGSKECACVTNNKYNEHV